MKEEGRAGGHARRQKAYERGSEAARGASGGRRPRRSISTHLEVGVVQLMVVGTATGRVEAVVADLRADGEVELGVEMEERVPA